MATLPAAVDLSTESIGGRPPSVLGPLLDLIAERYPDLSHIEKR
jgi:hypothetical protein